MIRPTDLRADANKAGRLAAGYRMAGERTLAAAALDAERGLNQAAAAVDRLQAVERAAGHYYSTTTKGADNGRDEN